MFRYASRNWICGIVGGTCSTPGERKGVYSVLVGSPQGKGSYRWGEVDPTSSGNSPVASFFEHGN